MKFYQIRILLDLAKISDDELEQLATGIEQTAPQGTLYGQSQAIKDSVLSVGTLHTKYKDANTTATATAQKLVTEEQAAADSRGLLLTSILQLKGLVETTAKTPADVKGVGYAPFEKVTSGVLDAPSGVDIFYPKTGKNRAKVRAQETGTRKRYEAQYCLDPLSPTGWVDLDGYGRSHWLTTFKSGQVVWVRFRVVRGHQKSDYCAPVCVTIP